MESALSILIISLVMMLTFTVDQAVKDWKYFVPEGLSAILIGFVIGLLDYLFGENADDLFTFSSSLFQLVLLPPIIFDAGFSLKKRGMFNNFGTIMVFAFVGTLISSLSIGFAVYWYLGGNLVECLMFGTLISAIDPVSSLAIFADVFKLKDSKKKPNPLIYNLVFGESLFNDGVCMVLFFSLENLLDEPQDAGTAVTVITLLFLEKFFMSMLIGIAAGMATALLFKYSNLSSSVTYMLFGIFWMALVAFMTAEYFKMSGIIAVFFCGIAQSHYTYHNLSNLGQTMIPRVFHAMAAVSETFVFNYLGMAFFAFRGTHDFDFSFIGLVIGLCFASRAVSIFGLTPIANLLRKHNPISFAKQIVIWFSGLRGAIAFALAVEMLHHEYVGADHHRLHGTPHSHQFMTTTLVVVIFTTLLCGFGTGPLLKVLQLDKEPAPDYHKSRKTQMWQNFDRQYLDPFLLGPTQRAPKTDQDVKLSEIAAISGLTRRAEAIINERVLSEDISDNELPGEELDGDEKV